MKKIMFFMAMMLSFSATFAQVASVSGPSGKLKVDVDVQQGKPVYSVTYNGKQMLDASPLGFVADVGDFAKNMTFVSSANADINTQYSLNRCKVEQVNYKANELKVVLQNEKKRQMTVCFRVSDNDISFRYELPRYGDTGCARIFSEATGFDFPSQTTTFLCPQSDPMIGWKRSKPSYEEEYRYDAPMTDKSQYGRGYTFPCLYRVGNDGWVLVSETGVDSRYCASHLSDMSGDGLYTIAFPMEEENNGNGSVTPGFALPGNTPWRTVTVGSDLKPIVETTAPWDNVTPRYEASVKYKFGRSSWSWIVWQDDISSWNNQIAFIDLAAKMGWEYCLVDAGWDQCIGREKMPELIKYANSKGVDIFLWYSSSGYWNDIQQTPINHMDNSIIRKKEMKWMHKIGVKGIKVDFFPGDKQETMRLYEEILSDADDNALMVIFHGCTIPRGWERMYPNYVGSEAVLASENIFFQQHFADKAAENACTHPFIRNTIGCMEFGGCFMNRHIHQGNKGGNTRRLTDCAELATEILFQNPIQTLAVTPENFNPIAANPNEPGSGAPTVSLDFLRDYPTTWQETRFVDGYPGKYVVLARRNGDSWYVAGINAEKATKTLRLNLSGIVSKGDKVVLYSDRADREPQQTTITVKNPKSVSVNLLHDGGFVIVKK